MGAHVYYCERKRKIRRGRHGNKVTVVLTDKLAWNYVDFGISACVLYT